MEQKNRIACVLEERDIKPSHFAKQLKVQPSTITFWMQADNAKNEKMEARNLLKAAEILGVNPVWLATGKGPKYPDGLKGKISPDTIALRGRVPLISQRLAGSWNGGFGVDWQEQIEKWIPTTLEVNRWTYALLVQGDSMSCPGGRHDFPQGSIIVVEPEQQALPGNFVIVLQPDCEEPTFKQLVTDSGQLWLKPLNTAYPMLPLQDGAAFCGVVRQSILVKDI